MATEPKGDPSPSRSVGSAIKRWFSDRGAAQTVGRAGETRPVVRPPGLDEWDEWTADPVSMSFLAGSPNRQVRSRQQVYERWQDMLADPIISSALRLHVTSALGGHESRGEMVFLESTPEAKKSKKEEDFVKSLADDLQALFNRIAPTSCFNAVAFGDSYGRVYAEPGLGVRDVYVDELVYPPVIQPYERGNMTIGYTVATGNRFNERLNVLQVARMKMPRVLYLPQNRVIEKAIRITLTTDKLEDLPAVPAIAGGSFLDGAEVAYDKFSASWTGLTGQRVQDSVDESMISVQQAGMTPAQRQKLKDSLVAMFQRSNDYINAVVKSGKSTFGRIYHFIPTSSDKQLTQIQGATGAGRASSLTIDDVMMNGRFLAGSLGLDLSMLGFADQLGGGLGEGGFFRVSAQSAERARAIRAAASEFFEHIIEVHCLMKHGRTFAPGEKRPWVVNYYSGISALETERAKTKADNMNSTALLVQTLAQIKDLGLSKEAAQQLLEVEMGLDAKDAELYAAALEKAAKEAKEAEAAANGGGFGGPGGPEGGMPSVGDPGAEPGEPGGGIAPAEG